MDVLWELELSTEAKHRLYKSYLDAWWPIMLQPVPPSGYRRPRVTYVDAFAGPGEYLGGDDGSPVFALERLLSHDRRDLMALTRDRVRIVFIEKEEARHAHLRDLLVARFGRLEDLPVTVEVRRGEAGIDTGSILDEVQAWGHPILAVFDSWGNVNVPHDLVRRIAHNGSSEVITTFGPNWFSRREDLDQNQLDLVFGGREYWEPADRETDPDERWRTWLTTYRGALHRAGFGHRLDFEVRPRSGQPLYLVHGTTHIRGVEVMKDVMWRVDVSNGMSFRDPRTRGAPVLGQLSLWDAPGIAHPELVELAMQRLAEGPLTLEELGSWLLEETARWRRKDARTVVSDLLGDHRIVVDPPGQLRKTSQLRLP